MVGNGAGGGGVSVYGEGSSGSNAAFSATYNEYMAGGGYGSGGSSGTSTYNSNFVNGAYTYVGPGLAGSYGAGGGATFNVGTGASGSNGLLRIIWGTGRAFPSTNTGDM